MPQRDSKSPQSSWLMLCWKKSSRGVAVLFVIFMVFSRARTTRLMQNFGLAVKIQLGVLWREPSVSHCCLSDACFRSRSSEVCLESTGTEGKMSAQTKRLKPRATNLFTDLKNSCFSSWGPLYILQRAEQKIIRRMWDVRSWKETDWTWAMIKLRNVVDIASRGVPGHALCKDREKVVRGLSLSSHKRPPSLNQKAWLFLRNSLNVCLCFCNVTKFSWAEVSSERHKAATVAHGAGQKTSLHFTAWKGLWENTSK